MNHPQPTIRSGEKIPHLDGTNDHLVFSREFFNKLVAVSNAILANPQWTVTDHGIINLPAAAQSPGSGLNYRGRWFRDNLIGQNFKKGDLVWIDDEDPSEPNRQWSRIAAHVGSSESDPQVFFEIVGGSGDGYRTLFTSWAWIFICIKDVTQTSDISFRYPSSGQQPPNIFAPDNEFWDLFCVTNMQQAVGNNDPVIPG